MLLINMGRNWVEGLLAPAASARLFTKLVVASAALLLTVAFANRVRGAPITGEASWYGEEHRGKLMANGEKFDPDKPTAASWFYPLGTRLRVTVKPLFRPQRSVIVTVTDRGPAWELVRKGRIIDLGHAPFRHLASPHLGLVAVTVQPVR